MQGIRDMKIRRATAADAEALAEFGARTFYESFARDNTAEDMARHLASAWRPDLQRAEIADPLYATLLAVDADGKFGAFAQLQAERAPAVVCSSQSSIRRRPRLTTASIGRTRMGSRTRAVTPA